jgi:hypothetical protein
MAFEKEELPKIPKPKAEKWRLDCNIAKNC